MADDKKKIIVEDVDVSELDKISGGSIDNVNYTETEDIDPTIQQKIE